MSQRKWYRSRATWLNIVLSLFAVGGIAVMIISLVIAFSNPKAQRQMLLAPTPTPSASASESNGIYSGPIFETHTYNFSKAKDLKAFKQAGFGTVKIVGKRLQIKSSPASKKSVSIKVNVGNGSTVRFDDAQSGEVGIDSTNFFIDGYSGETVSGTASGSAKYQVYPLEQGIHTLTWQYFTDSTFNLSTDAYYLDNIKITNIYTKAYLKG